jgi:hypothetical protein
MRREEGESEGEGRELLGTQKRREERRCHKEKKKHIGGE